MSEEQVEERDGMIKEFGDLQYILRSLMEVNDVTAIGNGVRIARVPAGTSKLFGLIKPTYRMREYVLEEHTNYEVEDPDGNMILKAMVQHESQEGKFEVRKKEAIDEIEDLVDEHLDDYVIELPSQQERDTDDSD